jgi:hypothetical protein
MSVFSLSGIIVMVSQACVISYNSSSGSISLLKKIRVSVLDAGFWIFFVSKACEVKEFWFHK